MTWKEKLIETIGTKLSDKVDGIEMEITASDLRIVIIDGKVDVETKNLKTKVRLAQNTKSFWEQQKDEAKRTSEGK